MGRIKVFVVEDDLMYSKILKHKLSMDPDFDIKLFSDGKSFERYIDDKPDIVTLDHSLPDVTGLELLKKIKKQQPNTKVIVLSAQEDVATALEMLRNGAYDYIIKDNQAMDKLWHLIHQANEKIEMEKEVEMLSNEVGAKYDFHQYIKGSSAPMQKVFALLEKSTMANITVSITVET